MDIPDEDRVHVKRALLGQHREALKLDPYVFDGAMLFTPHRLQQPLQVTSERREVRGASVEVPKCGTSFHAIPNGLFQDGKVLPVKIELVGEISSKATAFIQFFNIMWRSCMRHLEMDLVGRNYYDSKVRRTSMIATFT